MCISGVIHNILCYFINNRGWFPDLLTYIIQHFTYSLHTFALSVSTQEIFLWIPFEISSFSTLCCVKAIEIFLVLQSPLWKYINHENQDNMHKNNHKSGWKETATIKRICKNTSTVCSYKWGKNARERARSRLKLFLQATVAVTVNFVDSNSYTLLYWTVMKSH